MLKITPCCKVLPRYLKGEQEMIKQSCENDAVVFMEMYVANKMKKFRGRRLYHNARKFDLPGFISSDNQILTIDKTFQSLLYFASCVVRERIFVSLVVLQIVDTC